MRTRFRSINSVVMVILAVTNPVVSSSQAFQPLSTDPLMLLEVTRQHFARFDEAQQAQRQFQEQERRKIPAYNYHLNQALVAFHKHILHNEHPPFTTCLTCRTYFAEIQSYFKKLQKALK